MTAYLVPAALALYPPPPLDASPEPELAADADPQPVLSPTAASSQQVERVESPKRPAPKKSKQIASRPHVLRNKYFMTDTQFRSYGYYRPW